MTIDQYIKANWIWQVLHVSNRQLKLIMMMNDIMSVKCEVFSLYFIKAWFPNLIIITSCMAISYLFCFQTKKINPRWIGFIVFTHYCMFNTSAEICCEGLCIQQLPSLCFSNLSELSLFKPGSVLTNAVSSPG